MAVLQEGRARERDVDARGVLKWAKLVGLVLGIATTLWLARDLALASWLGLGAEAPRPVAAHDTTQTPQRPQIQEQPNVAATPTAPMPNAPTSPTPAAPAPTAPSVPVMPAPLDGPALLARAPQRHDAPVGTDPSRATLIDQIGTLQAQLVFARLKRELAQAEAEAAKLGGDLPAQPVEALLDRLAEREAPSRSRALPGVQAIFGRDGNFAARLVTASDGPMLVRRGDVIGDRGGDRWRVDAIDERAVTLVTLRGDARHVLRPGVGVSRAGEGDDDRARMTTRAEIAPVAPNDHKQDAALGQAPVAGSLLRPTR